MYEIKNSLDGFNSSSDEADDRISKFEKKKRTIENIKAEAHRGKRIGTTDQIIKDKFCIVW